MTTYINRPEARCLGDRFEVVPFEDCPSNNSKGGKSSTSNCDEFTQVDEACILDSPEFADDCVFPINEINNCGDESILRKLGSKSAKSTQSFD